MAVYELVESRRERLTMQGHTLTAVYKCTATDWDNNDVDLPLVGDYWPSRPDLKCTEVYNEWESDQYCKVYATFSTEGFETRQERPD
jgi:hypothetical protein